MLSEKATDTWGTERYSNIKWEGHLLPSEKMTLLFQVILGIIH